MLKGVLMGLLTLVLAVFAYVGYSGYTAGRAGGGDTVYADGVTSSREKAGSKGEGGGSSRGAANAPAMAAAGESNGGAGGNGMVMQGGAGVGAAVGSGNGSGTGAGVGAAGTDTIAPNPPNGMTFGGSGHFQLYRQGDLTWRLNTDTGDTCVLFATDEEWRKPKVYKAGCRAR